MKYIIVFLGFFIVFSNVLNAEPRHALVIGNGAYQAIGKLANPSNDARAVSEALTGAGFSVDLKLDAGKLEMMESMANFAQNIKNGGIGLFYYAGHGMQVRDANYLVPVDFGASKVPDTETQAKYQSVSLNQILDEMGEARNGLNIVVLDACRNNPLNFGTRSLSRGLARSEGPSGSLISYSTAPGATAADAASGGNNSPYTKHLVRAIKMPGLSLEQTFKEVLQGVHAETGGKQTPWISSSFVGDFYFTRGTSSGASSASVVNHAKVQWESIKESTNMDDFNNLINTYPESPYAEAARSRLESLQQQNKPIAPPISASSSTINNRDINDKINDLLNIE